MKVIELKAENFKRLRAVELRVNDDEAVIELSGANGAGKSSVLDAIWAAVGGKKVDPVEPVRQGEEKACVSLDLGNLKVERTWKEDGSGTIRVLSKTADGDGYAKVSSPQTVLNELINTVTFDPHAFLRLRPADQVKTLAELIGIDLEEMQKERQGIYDLRTDENRELKRLQAAAEQAIREAPLEKPEEIDTTALREKRDSLIANRDEAAVIEGKRRAAAHRIEELEAELKDLKKWMLHNPPPEMSYAQIQEGIIDAIRDLDAANDANISQVKWQEREETAKARDAQAEVVERLTERLQAHDEKRRQLIKDADIPVQGLTVTADGKELIFNDVPFEDASQGERLRVSMAIAMASNPKLRVAQIRDGSLLDSKSLEIIREAAREKDFQVWIERVDESEEVGIYIEDGQVKRDNR